MERFKIIIASTLILSLLSGSFNSLKANDCPESGNNQAALAGLVGFGVLFIFDLVTAPHSAKQYNKSHASMLRFIQHKRYTLSNHNHFGEPVFSRAALIKSNRQPVTYTLKENEKSKKSPGLALLWSLGATAMPPLLGGALTDGTLEDILVVSGITMGPSAGHFYSERYVRGLLTAALRIAFGVLFISNFKYCV